MNEFIPFDLLTFDSFQTGRAIRFYGESGATFGGVTSTTTYYIQAIVGTTLSVSTSASGSAMSLTATSSGANTLFAWSPDEYPGTSKSNVNNQTWFYHEYVHTWPPSSCSNCDSYSSQYAAAMSSGSATISIFLDEVRLSQRDDCAIATNSFPAPVQHVWSGGRVASALWRKVALGWDHSCATDTSSALHCWGRNLEGQVGDGSMTDVSRPRPVTNLPSPVSSFSLGRFHTCAVASGSLYCWGAFTTTSTTIYYGQSGPSGSLVASRIDGLPSAAVTEVVCGKLHTCALDSSGSVWCFGRNVYGQLGSGTSTNSANPAKAQGIPQPVTMFVSGIKGEATCVVTVLQQRWCWGENNFGQLGDGTTVGRYEPVGGVSSLVRIEPPGVFAIRNSMRLLIFGSSSFGVSPYKVCAGVQLKAQGNTSLAFDLTCSWLDPNTIEGGRCCGC